MNKYIGDLFMKINQKKKSNIVILWCELYHHGGHFFVVFLNSMMDLIGKHN
jgi:hypothetical protein